MPPRRCLKTAQLDWGPLPRNREVRDPELNPESNPGWRDSGGARLSGHLLRVRPAAPSSWPSGSRRLRQVNVESETPKPAEDFNAFI